MRISEVLHLFQDSKISCRYPDKMIFHLSNDVIHIIKLKRYLVNLRQCRSKLNITTYTKLGPHFLKLVFRKRLGEDVGNVAC